MENFDYKNYRDNLAKDIVEIAKEDKELAKAVLDSEKKSLRYQISKDDHLVNKEGKKDELIINKKFLNIENKDIEVLKNNVIELLRKYKHNIEAVGIQTSTTSGFKQTDALSVDFDSRWAEDFETLIYDDPSFNLTGRYHDLSKSGYTLIKGVDGEPIRAINFFIILGRVLHDSRPGNILDVTFRIKTENSFSEQDKDIFISTLSSLFKTLNIHYSHGSDQSAIIIDRMKIAQEIIPVLEALKEIDLNIKSNLRAITVQEMIDEYEKFL